MKRPGGQDSHSRRKAYRRGLGAEFAAAALLLSKGHVILARRYRTPLGEIDIVARRGKRVAFVEVKQRPSRALCEEALEGATSRRLRDAADLWLARHPRFQEADLGFDAIFVWPWHLPVYMRDIL